MNLFDAIEVGDAADVKRALESGADPNEVRDGWTPLLAAIEYEVDESAQHGTPLRVDKVVVLVLGGADPLYELGHGATAVLAASTSGHWLALELFSAVDRGGPMFSVPR